MDFRNVSEIRNQSYELGEGCVTPSQSINRINMNDNGLENIYRLFLNGIVP